MGPVPRWIQRALTGIKGLLPGDNNSDSTAAIAATATSNARTPNSAMAFVYEQINIYRPTTTTNSSSDSTAATEITHKSDCKQDVILECKSTNLTFDKVLKITEDLLISKDPSITPTTKECCTTFKTRVTINSNIKPYFCVFFLSNLPLGHSLLTFVCLFSFLESGSQGRLKNMHKASLSIIGPCLVKVCGLAYTESNKQIDK
jgi:hypothetical protein